MISLYKKLFVALILISAITILCGCSENIHMVYQVKEGENLTEIANRFGVDKQELMELNNIGEVITPGEVIKINK